MKADDATQKSMTDRRLKLMKNNRKFDVCYNVQTAVDSRSHLIADFTVTNNCSNIGLLASMAEVAKKAMEVDILEVVVDKEYRRQADVLESGIVPKVYESYKISTEIIAPGEYTITQKVIEKECEDIISEDIIIIRL